MRYLICILLMAVMLLPRAAQGATPGSAKLKLLGLSGSATAGKAYTILNTQGSGAIAASSFSTNLNGTLMDSEVASYSQGGLDFTSNDGSTLISVSFTAVPEPSAAAILLLLGSAGIARRRNRV